MNIGTTQYNYIIVCFITRIVLFTANFIFSNIFPIDKYIDVINYNYCNNLLVLLIKSEAVNGKELMNTTNSYFRKKRLPIHCYG